MKEKCQLMLLVPGKPANSSSCLKPVLNWAKCLLAEHTSDSSTNYDSFLN